MLRLPRNIRLAIKNLWLHKLRSMLTMLGVLFGVASVVAMLAVGEGASARQLEQIKKLGSNNILLSSTKPTEDEAGGSSGRRSWMSIYGLKYEDERRIRESLPHVVRTVPIKHVRKPARVGERELDLRVVGTTPGWFALVKRRVIAGRTLTASDMSDLAGVCVLTELGARKLLATEATIGKQISVGGDVFRVAGIVASEAQREGDVVPTLDGDVDAYIPLNAARERYGDIINQRSEGSRSRELVELHQIIVEVDALEAVSGTADAIRAMLERFHKRKDYTVEVPLQLLQQAEDTKRTFNIVLGTIAGISLLVGGIGIMNIMLASVTERTREIGVRRAIGAKRSQIIQQFLIETVFLSLAGGLLGIGVGIALPVAIETKFNMPTVVTPFSVILSFGISGAIGIVFGLYPAVRAANLDPIVALRHE
jgi:putative ABC transport system permease protein